MRRLIGKYDDYLIYVWTTGKYEVYSDPDTPAGISGTTYDQVIEKLEEKK